MNRELYIVNKEHPDFVRLYWSTDKERIKTHPIKSKC